MTGRKNGIVRQVLERDEASLYHVYYDGYYIGQLWVNKQGTVSEPPPGFTSVTPGLNKKRNLKEWDRKTENAILDALVYNGVYGHTDEDQLISAALQGAGGAAGAIVGPYGVVADDNDKVQRKQPKGAFQKKGVKNKAKAVTSQGGENKGNESLTLKKSKYQIDRDLHSKPQLGIVRVDIPSTDPSGNVLHNEQIHVFFRDRRSLNIDGTWKHGEGTVTNKQAKYLESIGFQNIPRGK